MRIFLVCFGLIIFSHSLPAGQGKVSVGLFSKSLPGGQFPSGWEPLLFKSIENHTKYTLIDDSGHTVVKAVSEASSSGLIRHVRIDPERYPIIEWRWKITNVLNKGDVTRKVGDDYPARLYITFELDPKKGGFLDKTKNKALKLFFGKAPPAGAINYIWANKAPIGTIAPSPYTSRSMMMVVQSGEETLNQWVTQKRNIFADYMAAFGKKPPMISGIAIMTDGNDTGESAVAYYGDIVMKSKVQKP